VQSYGLLLAFPVRPLGVLFGNRWHTRHAAVAWFPTQPTKNPRFSNSVSSRSVFARRGSRDTATLGGWIRCVSTPRSAGRRANQKPSRPASKASANPRGRPALDLLGRPGPCGLSNFRLFHGTNNLQQSGGNNHLPKRKSGLPPTRGVRGSPRKARICLRLREYYRNFWQLSRLHEGSHPQATNPKNPLSQSELARSSTCCAIRADAALRPLDNPAGRR